MDKQNQLRACLVMRAPLARYPSSVFQAELLEEAGLSVTVLDTEDGAHDACALRSSIHRCVVEEAPNPWEPSTLQSRLLAPLRRWIFERQVAKQLHLLDPKLVIAYEPAAIATVGRLASRAGLKPFVKVWHFHEYPQTAAGLRWGSRKDLEWSLQNLRAAEITVFPDLHRAERFTREMGQTIKPVVVMNCPRRLEPAPKPGLGELLRAKGYSPSGQAVLYVGAIGETHGLETAVRSMVHWPSHALLLLVGSAAAEFKAKLLNEATGIGVSQRIIFLGVVDPKDIWCIRAGATVALTVMEPAGLNRLLSAGASNKRFEAMAVGVPQVSDRNPGVPELVEQTGSGLCVPHDDAEVMGRAVARLLNDEPLRRQMGAQARRMHLERFNYETEFQPVLRQLLQWMEMKSRSAHAHG